MLSNIIFIDGIYIRDITDEKLNKQEIIPIFQECVNLCPTCNIEKINLKYFIVGMIDQKNNLYLPYGEDTFCSVNCIINYIKCNFNLLKAYSLLENLKFYIEHNIEMSDPQYIIDLNNYFDSLKKNKNVRNCIVIKPIKIIKPNTEVPVRSDFVVQKCTTLQPR